MAETDRASQVAAGMSTAAAIAAALAWLAGRKAEVAPPGEITIPPELMELLVSIAQSTDRIDEDILKILNAIASLAISGVVSNADYAVATRVQCPAANKAYHLPHIVVPDDMELVLLGWPLNAGWIQVGCSPAECSDANLSYPLLPGATVGYRVKNANCFYISAAVAGDSVVLTVEQRRAV